MNRSEKAQVVEKLSQRVGEAKCLYLTDFTGLDVASMTELRARLSGAEVEYVVVKNTLARRALADSPYAELSDHLVGPNAFAMSTDDVVSAAKILTDFAKEREKPAIKAGAIEGRVVSMDEIRRIAELPPREELLAQMVGYAKAPMRGLVYTLDGLLAKLVRTLEAVRAKKEEEGEAAPEAEVEEPVAEAEEAPVAEAEAEVAEEAAEAAQAAGEEPEQEPAEEAAEVEEPVTEVEEAPAAEAEAEAAEEETEAPRAAGEEPEQEPAEEAAEAPEATAEEPEEEEGAEQEEEEVEEEKES